MTALANPFLEPLVAACARVPGVACVVLGGSRARGRQDAHSDWDVGLLFHEDAPFDAAALGAAVAAFAEEGSSVPTPIGAWGPWIVGGAWLTLDGRRVDLLYRPIEGIGRVIEACRAGLVTVHDQPGHPHGFVSAAWMGEVALCRSLHDPGGVVAGLKALAEPYPDALAQALVQRFGWEAGFAAENALKAAARGDATHVAGCAYRTLACTAQVVFALNRRYLINEKGAVGEAAAMPVTVPDLAARESALWQAIGAGRLADVQRQLVVLARDLGDVAASCRQKGGGWR
jgi:hypothetical protein